jgi:uncharacterized coiled-coil protein SlyX
MKPADVTPPVGGEDMAEVVERVANLEGRFDAQAKQLDDIKESLVRLEDKMERRFDAVERRFTAVENRVTAGYWAPLRAEYSR